MVKYSEYRLGDLCKRFSSGKGISADLIRESGPYPVIGGNGLRGYTDTYNFDGECAVIGRQGAYCGNVQFFSGKGYMTEHAVVAQPNGENNAVYLTYKLDGLKLGRLSGQAAQPGLSVTKIAKLRLLMPPKSYQDEIANILSTFDKLIEVNNKRIKVLEQMAENLYKEWFVRFRFPSHESVPFENGLPKGWTIKSVKETFDIFDSLRVPLSSLERDNMIKIYPYYGAAELLDYVEDYLFDGIYLLLGEDGSVITPEGKPMLQYVWGKFWVNNHAHILQGKEPFSTEYIHLMFKCMDVTGVVTGSAQPKISQARLFKKKAIIPENRIIERFNSTISPMYEELRMLKNQNRNLVKQRDLLLPRLMSGKLEV